MDTPNTLYIKWIPDLLSDDSDGFFLARNHPFDGATEYRKVSNDDASKPGIPDMANQESIEPGSPEGPTDEEVTGAIHGPEVPASNRQRVDRRRVRAVIAGVRAGSPRVY